MTTPTKKSRALPLLAAWRNAIRDSDLKPTDKLVAYTTGVPGHDGAGGGAFRNGYPRMRMQAPPHDGAPESGLKAVNESGAFKDLNIKCHKCGGVLEQHDENHLYCHRCNMGAPRAHWRRLAAEIELPEFLRDVSA